MNEQIIKLVASIFRVTPHFKGKFRIGKFIQNLLNHSNQWKNPEFFIKLKNNTKLFIDVRSKTHLVPFWIGKRDQEMISLILKCMEPNSVIFDVGANIGYYTIPLAFHLNRFNVQVHAFEPVSSNYTSLMQGIKKNKVENNVIANKIALGDKEGSIEIIKTEKGNSGNAVLSINNENFKINHEREKIQMITLDHYIRENNIKSCDFIKIDIEGAEIFFIQGGLKSIKQYRPVIYGEFNSFFIKKFGFSIIDVWNLIQPLNYDVYIENTLHHGKFAKTEIQNGMENVLLIPKEKSSLKWLS